jgi:hypothetical protein
MSVLYGTAQCHSPLNVIELGSGCGIIGIGLAQLVPNCDVVLTDLPEAQGLLKRNIDSSSPGKGSRASSCSLDWESDLPNSIAKRNHDLILISDCTYNIDTIPALVHTLSSLISISPGAVICLATKVRHSSEAEFFALMRGNGLAMDEVTTIELPNLAAAYEGDFERVEIYSFCKDRTFETGLV